MKKLAALASLLLAAAADADTVRLLPSVRIAAGQPFTLADIADLDGPYAERLADTPIGKGEAGAFELGAERVRQQLVVAGANLREVELVGEKTVVRPLRGAVAAAPAADAAAPSTGTRLVDPAEHLGRATPLAIICEMVRNAFGEEACDLRLEIAEEQLARIAPRPGVRYEVAKKSTLRAARVELEVVAHGADGTQARTRVRVEPRFDREVLVAATDVRRGARAGGGSTRIERRMLDLNAARDAAPAQVPDDASFVRTVPAGALVERADIARAAEIKRRDTVTVRREVGMVAIEFDAVALEDGSVGDIIALERADRRRSRESRPLTAEVVAPGRAVIR